MNREKIIVIDFGGQYNQLIARRVRECNVYCEIYSYKTDIEKIKEIQPKGIIFTGGPNSVYLQDSPTYTKEIFELGIPVLGKMPIDPALSEMVENEKFYEVSNEYLADAVNKI